MRLSIASVLVVLGMLTFETSAEAQCTRDADCKGDRVCQQGACVDPVGGPAQPGCVRDTQCPGEGAVCRGGRCVSASEAASMPPPPSQGPGSTPSGYPIMPGAGLQEPASGWPIASSVMSFVFSGAVVGLGVAAGLNTNDKWLSIGLGASALGTMFIFGPICSTGQSSARRGTPVYGALWARIPAWILFGVTGIEGVVMIALGAADVSPPEGLIFSAAAFGGVAMILFGVDNLVSRSQAHTWYEEQLAARRVSDGTLFEEDDGPELTFAPVIAPVFGLQGEGATGATLGVQGAF